MPFAWKVRDSLRGLEARFAAYPRELLAAGVRAKNRAMTTVRKEGARLMKPEFAGVKVGTLKRQMRQSRATREVPRAVLTFSAKRFRLLGNLPLRTIATKWGTGVRLGRLPFRLELADGSPVSADMLRRFFVQRARSSGRVNVWVREGKRSEPFQAVVAPSLAHAFRERGIGFRLVEIGRRRFHEVLRQEMRFRLKGR